MKKKKNDGKKKTLQCTIKTHQHQSSLSVVNRHPRRGQGRDDSYDAVSIVFVLLLSAEQAHGLRLFFFLFRLCRSILRRTISATRQEKKKKERKKCFSSHTKEKNKNTAVKFRSLPPEIISKCDARHSEAGVQLIGKNDGEGDMKKTKTKDGKHETKKKTPTSTSSFFSLFFSFSLQTHSLFFLFSLSSTPSPPTSSFTALPLPGPGS